MRHQQLLSILLFLPLSTAFQTALPSSRVPNVAVAEKRSSSLSSSLSRQLDRRRSLVYAIKRGSNYNDNDDDQPAKSGWDNFKVAFYGSVDTINDIVTKLNKDSEKEAKDIVTDGYSEFEASFKGVQAPGKKIMSEYQARANALGVNNIDTTSSGKSQKSGFNVFKEGVYNSMDASSKFFVKEQPGGTATETSKSPPARNVPYKRSLAQDLNNEDLISSNPVKRIQAEMGIREKEAQMQAKETKKNIESKKQDLYKLIDSFQKTVDSIPEKVEQAEKAAKDAADFIKSVPDRVDKVVEDVKTIPTKVQQTATKTKESVEERIETTKKVVEEVKDIPNKVAKEVEGRIETTKKVVEDVKDIPNKVNKKIEDTKRQVEETKEALDETVTNIKVFVGLEKPKPKPPRLQPASPKSPSPPKEFSVQQFAWDFAGGVVKETGKLAWWATKSTADLAWSGAKTALEKAKESTPVQKPIAYFKPSPPKEPPKMIDFPSSATDTEEVEQEVADALKLAEASLRKANVEKEQQKK